MTDMTAEAERGDIEPTLCDVDDSDAQLRAALEKDRQRAKQVRWNTRATYRAMEGWKGVHSEEDWLKVCADSREQYESGRFFLERLGARLVSIEALAGHEKSDVLRLAASWTAGSKASVCGSRATAALDCAPGSRRRSTHVGATLRGALCYTPPSL